MLYKLFFVTLRLFKATSGSSESPNPELELAVLGWLRRYIQLELFDLDSAGRTPREVLCSLEALVRSYVTPEKVRMDLEALQLKSDTESNKGLNMDNVLFYNKEFSSLSSLLRLVDLQESTPWPDIITLYVSNAFVAVPCLMEFSEHISSIRSVYFERGEARFDAELKELQGLLFEFGTCLYNQLNPVGVKKALPQITGQQQGTPVHQAQGQDYQQQLQKKDN